MKIDNKRTPCLRFSRVVGYYSEYNQFNEGKKEEFNDRKLFEIPKDL